MVATSSGSRDGETDILFSADSGVENYDGREASECHATGIDITQCHDADMNKLGTKRYDKRPFWGHQQLRICAHFFADCTNCLNCSRMPQYMCLNIIGPVSASIHCSIISLKPHDTGALYRSVKLRRML